VHVTPATRAFTSVLRIRRTERYVGGRISTLSQSLGSSRIAGHHASKNVMLGIDDWHLAHVIVLIQLFNQKRRNIGA
jgi:hypothetical protein